MIASSLLQRAGFKQVINIVGGIRCLAAGKAAHREWQASGCIRILPVDKMFLGTFFQTELYVQKCKSSWLKERRQRLTRRPAFRALALDSLVYHPADQFFQLTL